MGNLNVWAPTDSTYARVAVAWKRGQLWEYVHPTDSVGDPRMAGGIYLSNTSKQVVGVWQ